MCVSNKWCGDSRNIGTIAEAWRSEAAGCGTEVQAWHRKPHAYEQLTNCLLKKTHLDLDKNDFTDNKENKGMVSET